jgi:dethiobiotin synthetase
MGRLVVVAGTGTGIGKTHVSDALLRALRPFLTRVIGIKPVETGVEEGSLSDGARLEAASSFHVKQSRYAFSQPASPHLAARESGEEIELGAIEARVKAVRAQGDITLVELAGGLFTPLSPSLLNVDLIRALRADFALLVASDRLGVLHDVLAATRAASAVGVGFDAVILVSPEVPDPSTCRNCSELLIFMATTRIYQLPRTSVAALASHPAILELAHSIARTDVKDRS